MVDKLIEFLDEVQDFISEIKLHIEDKHKFRETVRMLNKSYQRGQFGYFRYQHLKTELMKDKSLKEWEEYYDSYIYGILKRIEFYNSKIFYDIYTDKTKLRMVIPEKIAKKPLPKRVTLAEPVVEKKEPEVEEVKPLVIRHAVPHHVAKKDREKIEKKAQTVEIEAEQIGKPEQTIGQQPAEEPEQHTDQIMDAEVVGDVPASTAQEAPDDIEPEQGVEELTAQATTEIPVADTVTDEEISAEGEKVLKKTLFGRLEELAEPKKKKTEDVLPWMQGSVDKRSFWQKLSDSLFRKQSVFEQAQEDETDETKIEFKHMFSWSFIKNLVSRKGADKFISAETQISPSIIALKRYKMREMEKESDKGGLDTSLLLEEAHRIRSIIQKRRKFTVYEHSTLGALSNMMVKRISLSLIESFPDFFKQIYDNLRLADMKILSNTYVNIMMLGVMVMFFASYIVSTIVFFIQNAPLILIFLRAFVIAALFSAITFMGFYMYPNARISQRTRDINTNMPFAINHMSAVASSGVPPEAMFRLIAESREYEEFSVEIEKITDYIEVFGYDIVTAVKSVAATTPSKRLKEFFEGFISSVESGGDLKHYLSQKAEEAMLQYKLERQKYLESISTYSDIYTGLLIAAPLFFVVALSLVSMLGGKVAGLEVNSLIAIGTYIVIPLLNLAFIVFLEMTQPDV